MHVLLSSFSYEDRNSCKRVGHTCEEQDALNWIHQTIYPIQPAGGRSSVPHSRPKNNDVEWYTLNGLT